MRMNLVLKWAGAVAGAAVLLGVLVWAYVYVESEAIIQRRYPLPSSTVHAATTVKAIARGKHLIAIAGCSGCHGADLHGRLLIKNAILPVWSSNLKRLTLTDDELERAIRFGIEPDATSTWAMPSYDYTYMSEDDVIAIVSYLRALPADGPVRPEPEFDLHARIALLEGDLAPIAPDTLESPASLDLGPRYDGGHYLARVTCGECHGTDLTGSGTAPDLVAVAAYDRAGFFALLREGRIAPGHILKAMPQLARSRFHYFADYEIDALYDYLAARAKALKQDRR
ncbi:MAG: cytochrome c [Rhizomicrobium sp.]|jgi:mono/diheme cytochrome c family protein